jgi:long-chain acyl-CoA synthetase
VAFRNAAFRWFSRLGQAVPIEQGRSAVSSLAFGAAVLRRGKNLVWFPEGERSASGRLLPFKAGIGLLVAHCPVPVVPVYIRGTYAALPVGKFWPRLKPVTVVFGEPVMPGGREPLANRLHDRVAELARG